MQVLDDFIKANEDEVVTIEEIVCENLFARKMCVSGHVIVVSFQHHVQSGLGSGFKPQPWSRK